MGGRPGDGSIVLPFLFSKRPPHGDSRAADEPFKEATVNNTTNYAQLDTLMCDISSVQNSTTY